MGLLDIFKPKDKPRPAVGPDEPVIGGNDAKSSS